MATSPANIFDEFPSARPPVDTQVESLQKLQKAAQKISSILDLDQLIDNIVNDVAHSFGLLETAVYLYDEARGEMVLGGVHGCSVHSKGFRLKIGKEGMVGYVASTGQMRYAPDVRKDEYYVACEKSTHSEVAIPLHVGERLVGVFTASHPDLDAFPRQQIRILQALCDHVAVAIYNAHRFQSERAEREAMSRSLHTGLCRFRPQHPRPCHRRRLVRLHSVSRWPLGVGLSRCLWKRHSGRSAHVGYAWNAALSRGSLLRSGRGTDQTQRLVGGRLPSREIRHLALRGT